MLEQKVRKVLYLGLEVPIKTDDQEIVHYPVIRIVPRPLTDPSIQGAFELLPKCTHWIFTSKSAVEIFFNYKSIFNRSECTPCIIAVGKATAKRLQQKGFTPDIVAEEETAEGIVASIERLSLNYPYFFWPHAAGARSVITDYLQHKGFGYCSCIIYDTENQIPMPIPTLTEFDEVVFTSPSTVNGFFQIYSSIPKNLRLSCIGPVTEAELQKKLE